MAPHEMMPRPGSPLPRHDQGQLPPDLPTRAALTSSVFSCSLRVAPAGLRVAPAGLSFLYALPRAVVPTAGAAVAAAAAIGADDAVAGGGAGASVAVLVPEC